MATERRALVVDDDDSVRNVISDYLAGRGFEVVPARDGLEGAAFARRLSFDLVAVDLMMPRGGGLDVIRAVRASGSRAAVIVITGYATAQNVKSALEAGADKVMSKPVELGELGAAAEELMAGGDSDRES